MSLLLKQHYPDMNLTIDGKGMLSIISSDKKTSQYIASIDTSKEADIMWNNIEIALDEYIKKQNQNPENTGDKVPTSHEKTETQEQVDIIWYNGFTKASKYAESK